jgi:hypothetical protein
VNSRTIPLATRTRAARCTANLKEWLKGGAIDEDPELRTDLISRRYAYKIVNGRECIVLEPKEAMKQRGLASPDDGDALALTFAYPVQPSARAGFAGASVIRGNPNMAPPNTIPSTMPVVAPMIASGVEYDPFAAQADVMFPRAEGGPGPGRGAALRCFDVMASSPRRRVIP